MKKIKKIKQVYHRPWHPEDERPTQWVKLARHRPHILQAKFLEMRFYVWPFNTPKIFEYVHAKPPYNVIHICKIDVLHLLRLLLYEFQCQHPSAGDATEFILKLASPTLWLQDVGHTPETNQVHVRNMSEIKMSGFY